MSLNIKIMTANICFAIVASALLVTTELATAEDSQPKSNSPETDPGGHRERIERAPKEKATNEREPANAMNNRKQKLTDLRDQEREAQLESFRKETNLERETELTDSRNKERVAQLESFSKERKERERTEKADQDKTAKIKAKGERDRGKDKSSDR